MSGPVPPIVPDALTLPFWQAARTGVLTLPRCAACAKPHFYPKLVCPHCGGRDLGWAEVSPEGVLVACTTVFRAPAPAFADQVPYTIGKIRLDAGPSLLGRLQGEGDPGDRARVGFVQRADDWPLVVLRLVQSGSR